MKERNGESTFLGTLTIVFIILKLTNVIDWSWVWILSPIWIPMCLVVLTLGIVVLYKIYKIR